MNLIDCLPDELRGPSTSITRIAAGLSGAGVHRVEADGRAFVLKVSDASEPLASFQSRARIQERAANAGLAPRVIHTDEGRRAVLSELVTDRSFARFYRDPRTHEQALAQLGHTLRRVHELPLPAEVEHREARDVLAGLWSEGLAGFALPAFAADVIRGALSEREPARERPWVLSHNDVNPTNLVHDGERLFLVDWSTAGKNDPLYDLAAISVFLRMDEATCRRLLSAHDGVEVALLPPRWSYLRRLVGALCAAMFLSLARRAGHPGATGTETLEGTPPLGEFYERLRSGALQIASAEGQWYFGLAMAKSSLVPSS